MLLVMPMANAEIQLHYNGDPRFPMIDIHQGYVTYIDKTSLYVLLYAPPDYRVCVATFTASDYGKGPASNYQSYEFNYFYDDDDPYMFINRHGPRERLDPAGDIGYPNYFLMKTGEATFYLEYGIKFYGRHTWWSNSTKRYEKCLPDEFYDILDNKR